MKTLDIASDETVESFPAYEAELASHFAAELSCALEAFNAPAGRAPRAPLAEVVQLADPAVSGWLYVHVAPKNLRVAKLFARGWRAKGNSVAG